TDQLAHVGRVFIWLGASNFTTQASGLPSNADWTAEGETNNVSQFGAAVAAGDLDGDGFDEVIVGAPQWPGSGASHPGQVFVWKGDNSPPPVRLNPPTMNYFARGTSFNFGSQTTQFGASVSATGDVNGDGFTDLVVGAPAFSNGQSGEGGVFLYL